MRFFTPLFLAVTLAGCSSAQDSRGDSTPPSAPAAAPANPKVVFETNHGDIVIELFEDEAPISTKNILQYVDEKFYDGTVFHRVIKGFMVQGGGFTTDYQKKPVHPTIKNEATNGLKNKRGTVALARTPDPHSASSQFFINTVDNGFLNHRSPDPRGYGYCVFGRVVEGMDVVDAIENMETICPSKPKGMPCDRAQLPPGMPADVPASPVIIQRAYRKK